MHLLRHFKGFEDAQIELFDPFVLLIGRNGSGKTNVIEGVELLARLARGTPLSDITDIGTNAGQYQVRGGLEGCATTGQGFFELGFKGSAENVTDWFTYRVRVSVDGAMAHIAEERLIYEDAEGKERRPFETLDSEEAGRGSIRVRYDNFARGGNKPSVVARSDRSVLSQFSALVSRSEKNELVFRLVTSIQNHLRAAFVFDPAARSMRSYARVGHRTLLRDGSNLSAVLHALSGGTKLEKAALQRIVGALRHLPEEPIETLEFVVTQLGDVMLAAKVSGRDKPIDARLLSDGTLRALAILTALETAEAGSRVIVEEVDNGIHPSRVAELVRYIIECGGRRELNVLCTTHNPVLLDALTPEQVKSVVLCHRDPKSGASKLTRIVDLPAANELLIGGHLGDLVTRGIVEQHLTPGYEAAREKAMSAWLESLG